MRYYLVEGGTRLSGVVQAAGSKNAALALMAGSVLGRGENVLEGLPEISDVAVMSRILSMMGLEVSKGPGRVLRIRPRKYVHHEPPYDSAAAIRGSSLLLGPLLARTGRAALALPGGCETGSRPMDLHIKGLSALGANMEIRHGCIVATAPHGLAGAKIYLDYPSVGATCNIMMAATLARGRTIIENAAKEPEVVDLASFLMQKGARIRGAGTEVIRVEGVRELTGARHAVIPDRIEAATLMMAAAITGGDVTVSGVIPQHLKATISKLREMGAAVEEGIDWVRVVGPGTLKAQDTRAMPYPGFPTDAQPVLAAVAAVSAGVSVITDTVFENRFVYVDELKRLGALVRLEGRSAVIEGREELTGALAHAPDLRSGAALVVAALRARGLSRIHGVHHIERGYEDLPGKLAALGARVQVAEEDSGLRTGGEVWLQ